MVSGERCEDFSFAWKNRLLLGGRSIVMNEVGEVVFRSRWNA